MERRPQMFWTMWSMVGAVREVESGATSTRFVCSLTALKLPTRVRSEELVDSFALARIWVERMFPTKS